MARGGSVIFPFSLFTFSPFVLYLLPLIFNILFISGCDIFQTRTPQQPQQEQSGFIPATTPDQVITNLENAIETESADNYLSCLSDPATGGRAFSFVPSSDVVQQFLSLNWNRNSEYTYFKDLVAQSSKSATPVLTLSSQSPFQPLGSSNDSVLFSANYVLQWPNNMYPQQVQGSLQLHLGHNTGGIWSIYLWIDSQTDSLTWSDLKVRAIQ